MQSIKETAEWSRKQSEEKIVKALKDAEYQSEEGGFTFGELVEQTGLSTKTASAALKRLQGRKVADVRPTKRNERYTTLYFLTKVSEKEYPQLGISLRHYQELVNRTRYRVEPKKFLSEVSRTIARELLESLIVTKKARRELDLDTVRGLMEQFDFLVKVYVFYRKNRRQFDILSRKRSDTLNETVRILRDIRQVDRNPQDFAVQFDELIQGIRGKAG